ncbi:MAG: hypothetical protein A3K76_00650 [Euryarchaeota archaeon RBG_13_57_23]|nr:MAG: hypothetical protein A3K76_00650 [Euryarchaeota archaeon RBG_13_57_23]
MKGQKGLAFAIVASFIMLSGMMQSAPRVSAQGESLQLVSTTYYIVQGESDLIAGDESKDEFSCLKILSYELPYSVSRVYASVPSEARNVTAWVASKGLINSTFGREDSEPMAGYLYVDVPSWFERDAAHTNVTNSSTSILASGSILTNVSYDSGALHLAAGATEGAYVSALIPVPESVNIISANVTLYGTDLQNVTSEISNDNGSTWISAVPGTDTTLSTSGSSFHLKLTLTGSDATPLVTGFRAVIRYILPTTTFTVHLTYLWPGEFENAKAIVDLTEPVPYASGGSSFVFLYVVEGYSAEGIGMTLNLDEDGDTSAPNKAVYVNMTVSLSGNVSRSVQVLEPESNWTWLLLLILIAAAFGGGAYVLWKRKSLPAHALEEPIPEEDEERVESHDDLASRKAELMARKAEIAGKMDALTAAKASGAVPVHQADNELELLRSEFRKVRNEQNRVSKRLASSASLVEPDRTEDSYDSMLASIARIDEDFEKGRLPEKTYRSLRKEYTSKAAKMLAERDSSKGTEHPLEKEKTKLMEAIVTLEEEHERGQVDAKVYGDLQASYRRELADLLRQIEGSKED